MNSFQTESSFRDDLRSASLVYGRLEPAEMQMDLPNVFIVDGDRIACDSLAALVAGEGWRSQTFESAEEFLAHHVDLAPGCLILDVCLPGLSGLELQKRAAVKCSHIPTVCLSAKEDIPTTVEAMKAGAIEFLLKPIRQEAIVSAIKEALERSRLVIAREKQKQAIQKCYASLSLREKQVMTLVCAGLLNKEVGFELGISEITVKAHRGQVMRKMRAASLADLVKMAGKLGLAKTREAMMPRIHVDPVASSGGNPPGTYGFVQ
jgi:FixJ family two-component response regulator